MNELTPDQELEAAITADLKGVGQLPSADPVQPEGDATSVVASPEVAQQSPSPTTLKIVWNGQERNLTLEEASEFARKGFDYTQKTMSLADQRRQVEAYAKELQGREAARQEELRNLLLDDVRLETYLNALRTHKGVSAPAGRGPAPAASPVDDEELISRAEFERLLSTAKAEAKAEAIAAARQESQSASAKQREDLEIDRMADGYRNDFDRTLHSLVTEKFPILSDFGPPDIKDRIKAEGKNFLHARMTLNPGVPISPEEIKSAMVETAKRWSDHYEGKLREREKKFVTRQEVVMSRGPEPRGGSAPPAPASGRPMKLNDPKLDEQVLAEIQSIMGR